MEKIKLTIGDSAIDDRGKLSFVNDFNFDNVKRFYVVENFNKGFIRAWHGHLHESKHVYVTSGSILIGAAKIIENPNYNISFTTGSHHFNVEKYILDTTEKFILSSEKPRILTIPAGYANGFKTLEENTKVIFFSDKGLNESHNDDIRFKYDIIDDFWNINYR